MLQQHSLKELLKQYNIELKDCTILGRDMLGMADQIQTPVGTFIYDQLEGWIKIAEK